MSDLSERLLKAKAALFGGTEAEWDAAATAIDEAIDLIGDLLEAAKCQDALMRTPGDPTENIQRVIKMRRAAIAKAEGRL